MDIKETHIKLNNINDLFIPREINPLKQQDLYETGIQEIISIYQKNWKFKKHKILIHVNEKIINYSELDVNEAINRYCDYKIKLLREDNNKQRIEILKTFSLAIIILSGCLIFSNYIKSLNLFNSTVKHIISEGLFIGGWVSLWHPIELLLYERWNERWDTYIYEEIKKADINII